VKQLSDETKALRNSIGTYMDAKYRQNKLEEERAKLLERRRVSNRANSN
jgi:hypothetical protein